MSSNIADRMLEELPDRSRWAKNAWVRENGAMCLIGTYSFLMTGHCRSHIGYSIRDPYMDRLAGIIREQFPERVDPAYSDAKNVVMYFNDHPETWFPDVRLVLEKAAAHELPDRG